MKHLTIDNGFSLVELLVVITLTILVGGLLLSILVSNTNVFYRETAKVSQGVGVNDVLSNVSENVKQSIGVASGYPVSSPTYTSGAATLVVKLPSIDQSGNTLANTFDYVVYYQDVDKLRFKIFPDPLSKRPLEDKILVTNLDSLNFEYFDKQGVSISPTAAAKVKLTIILEQKAGTTTQTSTNSVEVELRND